MKDLSLKEWRVLKGLTQEQLAKELDTSTVSISRYESRSRKTIRSKMVDKILILTNGYVTANSLYGITDDKIKQLRANGL